MTETVWITPRVADPEIERGILGNAYSKEAHRNIEVALVWRERVDDQFLEKHPKLRAVIRYGVGYENIDVDATDRHGVVACNNPAYGVEEVSDTAVAMIFGMSRGILAYDAVAAQLPPTWQQNVNSAIRRTSALTVGIIGAGRIGGRALLKCRALGFQTIFYDPYLPQGQEKVFGCRRADTLGDLLRESDIVSFHAPLTPETQGLVDEAFVRQMRPGSTLVNTARGGVIASLDVLYEPLKSGHLAGVALDVLPDEPPRSGPLIEAWRRREPWLAGRCLINPHTAYYSLEAEVEMRETVARNALRIIEGKPAWNVVGQVGRL